MTSFPISYSVNSFLTSACLLMYLLGALIEGFLYKFSSSKVSPSSLTQFPNLLRHASMNTWKPSPWQFCRHGRLWRLPRQENGSPRWSHTQIFGDNLSNAVEVQDQLSSDQSSSQPTIATHHLPRALNVGISHSRWRSSPSGVGFHVLESILLCHSKNPGARHRPIFVSLPAVVRLLLVEFTPAEQEISGWFVALCPSIDGLKLKCLLIKARDKKHNGCSWNRNHTLPRYYITRWRKLLIPTLPIAHTALFWHNS